jgi:hypothetical protein
MMSALKRDKLDGQIASSQTDLVEGMQGTYEKQFETQTKRIEKLEKRTDDMDSLIHKQAVKITRLIMAIVYLKSLLKANKVDIDPILQNEIDELTDSYHDHGPAQSSAPNPLN